MGREFLEAASLSKVGDIINTTVLKSLACLLYGQRLLDKLLCTAALLS